jgi:hypothetical protein
MRMFEALKRNPKLAALATATLLVVIVVSLAVAGVLPGLPSWTGGGRALGGTSSTQYSTVKPDGVDVDDDPVASAAPHGTAEPAAAFDDDYAGSLDGLDSPQRASYSIVESDASAYPINDRIESIITSRNGGMLPTLDVRGDYETQPFAENLCVWNQSSAQKGIQLGYVKDTAPRRKIALT